jgi:hypothetical protein
MDQAIKQENMPSGGIADFIYTDEELEQLEEKELKDLYGQKGIAQFKSIGKEIASFGRYGDDTVAHVETGELIVPRALIESNPKLKESIFGHLRELGVEDPERYVVGTSKNSLNPDTGLPEFFLKKLFRGVKKTVSKIGRGVKKAVKGVGKALKKVAPIVVPIALNYFLPGLGQIYSGALGSGITALLQGASVKDALKASFIGGATGAISAGISGPKSGLKGFGENIAADVSGGTANIKEAFTQGSLKPLTSTSLPSVQDLTSKDTEIIDTNTISGDKVVTDLPADKFTVGPDGKFTATDAFTSDVFTPKTTGDLVTNPADKLGTTQRGGLDDVFGPKPTNLNVGAGSEPKTFLESAKDYGAKAGDLLFGGEDVTPLEVLKKEYPNLTFDQLKSIPKDSALYLDAVEKAADASPGIIRRFGPTAALAGASLYGGGAFDVPEQEPLDAEAVFTGFDRFKEDPDKFRVGGLDPRVAEGATLVDSSFRFQNPYLPYFFSMDPFRRREFTTQPINVAEGGEIFPRRNGGISPREGTPGKDSVRAMLMPGEFVMTTDAVKGLGNGSLDKGIKNMYSVMSRLEKRGKRMA